MKKYIIILSMGVALWGVYLVWCAVRGISCKKPLGNVLIIGTNAEYPPFSFLKENRIVGFDIDIAQEVARRLGKQVQLLDMPFDMLLPYLQLGKIHMVAAGISPKPTRAKHVLFSRPYFENDPLLVITPATKKRIASLEDMVGKTVVVNDGYTADSYISKQPGIVVQRLATPAEAILALQAGRADAYVAAQSSVQRLLDKQRNAYTTYALPDTTDAYALVISPVYPELLPLIQEILDTMTGERTLHALKQKWGLT